MGKWQKRLEVFKICFRWTYEASPFLALIGISFSILNGLITVVEPYLFKILIDRITANSEVSAATVIGVGLVGILAMYGVARWLQNMFWDLNNMIRRSHALRIESYAMHKLMEKVSSLDMMYFEKAEYYNTLTKATQNFWRLLDVFWSIAILTTQIVSVVVIGVAIAAYDYWILLIIAAGAIPGMWRALKVSELLWSAYADASPISRHAYYYKGLLTEQPESIREIRTFGLREHFLGKFKGLFGDFIRKQDTIVKKDLIWMLITGIFEGVTAVIAAVLVIKSYLSGSISIGSVTFLWALLFQFSAQLRWAVRIGADTNTHVIFLTPFVDVLHFRNTILDPDKPRRFPHEIHKGIEFRNVTFTYPGSKKPVLKNFNLRIGKDKSIALVGENGSGKTTLVKLLCRFYDVDSGEILIDGRSIKDYRLEDLARNIGVIFQDFTKYEALIKENIWYGDVKKSVHGKDIHKSAQQSGAWEFIKELDRKYSTQVGKKLKDEGTELSGGQWQKIALARAFFKDAPILVLDEPTSAVDAKSEYKLFQIFKEFTKNKLAVLISHRFSTVRMADKIVVIEKGRIVEEGSHQELLKRKGTYASLFRMQAEGYK